MGNRQDFALQAAKKRGAQMLRRLYDAQRGRCYLCGRDMPPPDYAAWNFVTKDEVVPRSAGGRRVRGNVALAHKRCNYAKGSRAPYACEVMYARIVRDIMTTEPTPRRRRFVKPFEPFGR